METDQRIEAYKVDADPVETDRSDNYQGLKSKGMPSVAGAFLSPTIPFVGYLHSFKYTIHVSFSTAERTFSALEWVKSWIRSSMVQDRLEDVWDIWAKAGT